MRWWPIFFFIMWKIYFFPFFCGIVCQNRSSEPRIISKKRGFFFGTKKKHLYRYCAYPFKWLTLGFLRSIHLSGPGHLSEWSLYRFNSRFEFTVSNQDLDLPFQFKISVYRVDSWFGFTVSIPELGLPLNPEFWFTVSILDLSLPS